MNIMEKESKSCKGVLLRADLPNSNQIYLVETHTVDTSFHFYKKKIEIFFDISKAGIAQCKMEVK